jgi:Gluconate 2-dehydrogenase subunit 3
MERRELLKMIAVLTGTAFVGGEVFLSGCKNESNIGGAVFTAEDIAFMDEVGETILPRTKSPGAKDAEVGKFMTVMINDCYDDADQKIFHEGLRKLDDASQKMNNTSFMKATPQQRHDLLVSLDKEAKNQRAAFDKDQAEKAKGVPAYKKEKMSPHYFTLLKQLTLLGFFTSKPGETEALRHIPIPGKYDGAFPYKKGDRAWAE